MRTLAGFGGRRRGYPGSGAVGFPPLTIASIRRNGRVGLCRGGPDKEGVRAERPCLWRPAAVHGPPPPALPGCRRGDALTVAPGLPFRPPRRPRLGARESPPSSPPTPVSVSGSAADSTDAATGAAVAGGMAHAAADPGESRRWPTCQPPAAELSRPGESSSPSGVAAIAGQTATPTSGGPRRHDRGRQCLADKLRDELSRSAGLGPFRGAHVSARCARRRPPERAADCWPPRRAGRPRSRPITSVGTAAETLWESEAAALRHAERKTAGPPRDPPLALPRRCAGASCLAAS